ncbi:MAG TPA: VOC family protein [Kofleriaceae bacterium]|nr:VOC family protein [Kofleriaceae bacterium]
MAKITGLGGFFFRTADPDATARWFTDMLDLPTKSWGRMFPWRDHEHPEQTGATVMGLHGETSSYFEPSKREFMLNLIVDDLDGVLAELRARGVEIIKVMDPDPYGRFAHVMGPDGIKLELWQPAPDEPEGA